MSIPKYLPPPNIQEAEAMLEAGPGAGAGRTPGHQKSYWFFRSTAGENKGRTHLTASRNRGIYQGVSNGGTELQG